MGAESEGVELITIITPGQYQLNGYWIGPANPKRVYVHVHGLTSNMLSAKILHPLVDDETAVLGFNNRGHDIVSKLKHLNPNNPKGYDSELGGTTHEVFEDCVDDLEGAVNFAKERGPKNIYLVGHSTGCQKSVFYLSKTKHKDSMSGVVLLCPLSDYAALAVTSDKLQYQKALAFAQQAMREGHSHSFVPDSLWPAELLDAQRFISLYTPDSAEEIFSYSQPKKDPAIFKSVKTPMLVMLAADDEYADRPAHKLQEWFDSNHQSDAYKNVIIPEAPHNLKGSEQQVCQIIQDWCSI